MTRSILRFTLVLLLAAATTHTDPVSLGILRAQVVGPREQSMPRELTVRVRPSLQLVGQENLGWENTVSCPIQDGEWTCRVPAGRVDLRLTGTAVQPIYRWGVIVIADETGDLGTLQLRRGGSICGSVRPDGKIPQYSVRVDLLSLGATPQSLRTATLESTTRPWGFFRFEGVPSGRYVVEVTDPGLPTLRSNLILFEGDRSVELPPLILKRIGFSVRVTPPKDRLGFPWQVALLALPRPNLFPQRKEEVQKTLSSGLASFADITPGDYTLLIASSDGPRWFRKDLHLDRTTAIEVNIPFIRVKGRVVYKNQGLRSKVSLWDSSRVHSFSFNSDEQGGFEGYVNDVDSWSVAIEAKDPPLRVILQDRVKVPKAGAAPLLLRLPDTSLTAEVVDARGRLATRTSVQVLGEVKNIIPQGEQPVRFIALNPGLQRVRIVQEEPSWPEDPVEVELREGKESHLRLRLPKTIDIQGRVLPRLGWPTDVRVFAWPSGKSEGVGVRADTEGNFRFVFPENTRTVQLAVLPAGNALRIFQSPVSEHKLLEIPLRRPGGTLVIEGPGALVEVPEPKEGEPLKRSLPVLLRQWADLQGAIQSPGRLMVPNVEPGTYTLCPGSPFTFRQGGMTEGETGCASGVLKAAGELTLRLPASSPETP